MERILGTMKAHISAPSISIDLPAGWVLEETVDSWAVAVPAEYSPELAETFLPNVAFLIMRLESDVTIEMLADGTLEELHRAFTNVVVHELVFGEGIMDRSLTFTAEGIAMFQYQRNMLLPSFSDDVHWFAQIHATAPLDQEALLKEAFRHMLLTTEITPGA
jgi:hypothetical protein